MKKKGILIISGIIIVLAIAAMLIFVFSGNGDSENSAKVNLEGTWKVVAYSNLGNLTVIENEFMVFENGSTSDYRDGNVVPFVSSKYEQKDNEVTFTDLSKTYIIDKKTDNYICLYEAKDVYRCLIRYKNDDMSPIGIDDNYIIGKWDIVFGSSSQPYQDCLVFDSNGTVSRYKDGSEKAIATAEYSMENGQLVVTSWNKSMIVYPITDSSMILFEIENGAEHIWDLKKAD